MNPSALTVQAVDPVFLYIFGISVVMLLGITVTMIYFVVRYRRPRHPRPEASPHYSILLETLWTVVPTLIVLTMFWYGWQGYTTLRDVPADALEVQVTGRKWSWLFEYPNGRTSDRLVVPVDKPVVVDITSEDVIHSFYIPAFRIKKDAVPGMHTHAWFQAPAAGSYDAFCTEYCGVGHSSMITTVEAVPEHEFEEWYRGESPEEERAEGRRLLAQYGCTGCHSLDGSTMVGPTFKGLFGREVTVVTDGRERTVTADEAYLKRSILHPGADLVKGFPPAMPGFEDKLSEHDLQTIIDYFKAEAGAPVTEGGRELAKTLGCLGCHSTDGSKGVGPTFKGLYGKQVTVVTDGREHAVTADEDYLRRSLRRPQADLVKGYPAAMPSFAELEEARMRLLIDYLKGLQ